MVWCLPSYLADTFLAKIKDGTITPEKMIDMTSAQRREFFAKEFGEANAQQMNTLLESKLILKNQQKGMVTWAKKVSGITPEARRGLVNRVNKMSEILTPETEDAFLEDLAAHVMGTTVTMEEAANITTLAQDVALKKEAMEEGTRRVDLEDSTTKTEMDYGWSLVMFENYVNSLKILADKHSIPEKIKGYIASPAEFILDAVKGIANTSKALKSTLDNSFVGKQGRKLFYKGVTETAFTPTGAKRSARTWLSTFVKSHKILINTFRGKPVMDELRAEIISDPKYDIMQKMGVATATIEEEIPTTWFENIPYLGIPFKAADNAFIGSSHWMRYKVAKQYIDIAEKTKGDLTSKEALKSQGQLINSLTARGDIGTKSQKPGLINALLWSPRMIKADIDLLTVHLFDKGFTKAARKQAAANLFSIIIGQAIVYGIASLIKPDSTEWDPRSADYGKIRIKNTRFDISVTAPLIRLAVRLVPLLYGAKSSIKSTSTGETIELNTGKFGAMTGLDVLYDFIENKKAPALGVIWARLSGNYKYTDKTPTVVGDLRELFSPLPVENVVELLDDEESANLLISIMADEYGVFTSTYGKHYSTMTVKELQAEIKDNLYKRNGTREDGSKYYKNQPRRGKENYVKTLKKERKQRSGAN